MDRDTFLKYVETKLQKVWPEGAAAHGRDPYVGVFGLPAGVEHTVEARPHAGVRVIFVASGSADTILTSLKAASRRVDPPTIPPGVAPETWSADTRTYFGARWASPTPGDDYSPHVAALDAWIEWARRIWQVAGLMP